MDPLPLSKITEDDLLPRRSAADRVCAVVCGKALLSALERQTRPPDDVLVHSGPVRERLEVAADRDATWFWLLEEDVVPEPTALDHLLAPVADSDLLSPVLMASKVVGPDGLLHPRSAPWPRTRGEIVITACQHRLMSLRLASWGSLLVHRDALAHHGPPREDFRSGADDLEWTARILTRGHGYLAPTSIATRSGSREALSRPELLARVRMILGNAWVSDARAWFAFRVADDAVRSRRAKRMV